MPRRRGFLGRLIESVERILTPARREPEPPEYPSREPPPQPGRRSGYRLIFDREIPRSTTRRVSRETGYSRNEQFQLHVELFTATYMSELEPEERDEAWESYLESFVMNRRTHREFFSD